MIAAILFLAFLVLAWWATAPRGWWVPPTDRANAAPSSPAIVRRIGEVAEVLVENRRGQRWGVRLSHPVAAYELADGSLRISGGVRLPHKPVAAIIYRSADDRFGEGTRGARVAHKFHRPFPRIAPVAGGYTLAGGNYTVGPCGIVG